MSWNFFKCRFQRRMNPCCFARVFRFVVIFVEIFYFHDTAKMRKKQHLWKIRNSFSGNLATINLIKKLKMLLNWKLFMQQQFIIEDNRLMLICMLCLSIKLTKHLTSGTNENAYEVLNSFKDKHAKIPIIRHKATE